MRGAQTLGDALKAALVADKDDIGQAAAPVLFQAELAADQLERRAASMGMSPQMVERCVRRGFQMVSVAEEWCESPIEKRLLPWLVFADFGDRFLSIPAGVHSPKHQNMMPDDDVLIIPQFAFARYRMDFAILTRIGGKTRIVCVECDGDGYHIEGQDGQRDEYLRAYGIPTIRMTGKEITASAGGAIARVAEAVRQQVEA